MGLEEPMQGVIESTAEHRMISAQDMMEVGFISGGGEGEEEQAVFL